MEQLEQWLNSTLQLTLKTSEFRISDIVGMKLWKDYFGDDAIPDSEEEFIDMLKEISNNYAIFPICCLEYYINLNVKYD
jgi:hypothetical protein